MAETNRSQPVKLRVLDGLLVISILTLTFLLGCFKQRDADIWWHLKTGQMILERGELPVKDWFTFTQTERDWIDLHWLFQIAAARLYAIGGLELLTALSAMLGTLAVAVQLLARRCGWSVPVAVACWFPVLFVLCGRMYVRPEVVTLVCMSLSLTILFHAANRTWLIWLLVPVQLLWVNVQGLFVLGLVLAGFYWLDGWWLRFRRLPGARLALRTALLVALTATSLINPYGVRGLLFPIELLRKMSWDADLLSEGNFYSKHVSELESIRQFISHAGPWHFYILMHFGLLALAALSFFSVWSLRRFDLFRLVTFAAFAWLSLQATRNSGQFALVAGAVMASNFGEWAAGRNDRRKAGETRQANDPAQASSAMASAAPLQSAPDSSRIPIASGDPALVLLQRPVLVRVGLAAVLVAACYSVASGRFYRLAGEGRLFGLGEHPLWHAHDAARFAARPGMPARMLAFHLGHAAVFEFHKRDDQRTFCDPRLEVVSRDVLAEYVANRTAIAADQPGWPAILRRHQLHMILADHRHQAVEATLLSSPEWRCVHFDAVAALFLRDEIAAELRIPPVDFSTRRSGSGLASSSEIVRREAEALYLMGRNLIERRSPYVGLARHLLIRAETWLRESVHTAEARLVEHLRLWGQVCFWLSLLPTATDLANSTEPPSSAAYTDSDWLSLADDRLREAVALRPDDFDSLVYLYSIAQRQKRIEEQIELGERILRRFRVRPWERIIKDRIAAEIEELRQGNAPGSPEQQLPSLSPGSP